MSLSCTPWTTRNDLLNYPVRPIPDKVKGLEVDLNFSPLERYDAAGIMLRVDDDNFIIFSRGRDGDNADQLVVSREEDGEYKRMAKLAMTNTHIRLRLTLSPKANTVSASWQVPDQDDWTKMGKAKLFKKRKVKVSVYAHNGISGSVNTPLPARFTRFRFLNELK